MNYDSIVVKGCAAWLPNKNASDLEALHVHDVPLIGTFELSGSVVLYACLTGAISHTSVWGYTELEPDAVGELDKLDVETTMELEEWAHLQFHGRPAAFALAVDGVVDHWSTGEVDERGVLEACIRFMDLELEHLTDKRRRAEQARADATRRELEKV
jgi:hypothetical protein